MGRAANAEDATSDGELRALVPRAFFSLVVLSFAVKAGLGPETRQGKFGSRFNAVSLGQARSNSDRRPMTRVRVVISVKGQLRARLILRRVQRGVR